MKTSTYFVGAKRALIACMTVLVSLAASNAAMAEQTTADSPQHAASAPESTPVQTVVNGFEMFDRASAGPVFIEFDGSPLMSAKLAETARAAGFVVVERSQDARTVVRVTGELSLNGGPKFYRGIKFPLGSVSEKALAEHDGKRDTTAREIGGVAMLAVGTQLATTTLGVGFGISNLSMIIGDMTGIRGWGNTKLTGDPRGWCLSRCSDWNKVNQVVDVRVTWETGGQKQSATATSKAFSETLVPDALVNSAISPVFAMFSPPAPLSQVTAALKH